MAAAAGSLVLDFQLCGGSWQGSGDGAAGRQVHRTLFTTLLGVVLRVLPPALFFIQTLLEISNPPRTDPSFVNFTCNGSSLFHFYLSFLLLFSSVLGLSSLPLEKDIND